jgi:hypothetical protein
MSDIDVYQIKQCLDATSVACPLRGQAIEQGNLGCALASGPASGYGICYFRRTGDPDQEVPKVRAAGGASRPSSPKT